MRQLSAVRALATALLLGLALAGCGSPEEKAQEYLASAQKFMADNEMGKADIELRNALKLNPRLAEAHFLRSRVLESKSAFQDALRELQSTVQIDEGHLEANLRLANIYATTRQIDEAQAAIDRARKAAPDDFRVVRAEAMLLALDSRLEEALAMARKALAASPKDLDTQVLLGGILLQMKDYPGAAALLSDALAQHPDADQLYLLQFQLQAAQQQVDAAVATLRQLIALKPDKISYRQGLAVYLARNQRPADAEAVLRQAVADIPASKEAKLALASFLSTTDVGAAAEALKGFIARGGADTVQLQLALAELYTRQGDLDEAVVVYQSVSGAEDKADSLLARNQLARIAFKKGNPTEASSIIEAILADDPGNAEALVSRAGLRLASRETGAAISDLREALGQDPGLVRAHILMAQAQLQDGAMDLAAASLVDALKIEPGNEDAAVQLAALLMRERRFDKALEVLKPLTRGGRSSVRAQQIELQARLAMKDWAAANELAGKLGASGNNPQYQQYIAALALQAQGKHAEAIDAFSAVIAAQPDMVGALAGIVRSEREQGKGAAALERVAAFIAAHPDSLEARQLLATELLRDGKLAEVKVALDAGLAKDPAWLAGYRGLGILALREGKPAEALAAYDRALAVKPDAVEFKLLAASLLEKNDKTAAEARYRDVLATNPAADVAANNLAVILAADGKDKVRLEEALVLARRFENSGQPFFADTYGWILYMQGDYAKAATILDRVVKAAPEQAIFRYHLGAALYQTKDLPGAKLQLAQAEKLSQGGQRFEGYDEAMAMLAQLQ